MKYNRYQQFVSVAMALLVFISTLSVSIEKHYCGDHLVDVGIFSDAEDCGMETSDIVLSKATEGTVLTKKSCCKDVIDLHEGQDELSVEITKELNTNQKVFILSMAYVFSGLDFLEPKNNIPFQHYIPPTYSRDFQALNQVFLI